MDDEANRHLTENIAISDPHATTTVSIFQATLAHLSCRLGWGLWPFGQPRLL
jgi:hypothetical protein